jgi:lysyl-tRNA synthetase class 2
MATMAFRRHLKCIGLSEQKRLDKQRKKEEAKAAKAPAVAQGAGKKPKEEDEELNPNQYFELRSQVLLSASQCVP